MQSPTGFLFIFRGGNSRWFSVNSAPKLEKSIDAIKNLAVENLNFDVDALVCQHLDLDAVSSSKLFGSPSMHCA